MAPGDCFSLNHCQDISDWLRLEATSGQRFVVETCNEVMSSDTLLRVYDPLLNLFGEDDDSGMCDPRASAVAFLAGENGTYYIEATQSDLQYGEGREYNVCLHLAYNLLRNDEILAASPVTPPLDSVLPLSPLPPPEGDLYYRNFPSGEVDPQTDVVWDVTHPLVFYAAEGPGRLLLAKTSEHGLAISF
jgi:hypothetical protein